MKNKTLSLFIILSLVCSFPLAHSSETSAKSTIRGGTVEYLNSSKFSSFIAEGIVVVDFYADWCAPCKRMAPIYTEIAAELGGKAAFGKVNVDADSSVFKRYNVNSMPTFILFRDGKEIGRRGSGTKSELKSWIESQLN